MSVCAHIIRILADDGKSTDDMIMVATAMERGDDARAIYSMLDSLSDSGCPNAAISIAVCELARKINEVNARGPIRMPRLKDAHSSQKDSNRSRRGISDNEWRTLRAEIFERDGHLCVYCGSSEDLTCDHVIPLVRGGSNEHANLATACRSCNSSKGDKTLEEWPRYGN